MKLVTSEMDAEAEKWDEPQNEIAKVCFVFFFQEQNLFILLNINSVQRICHQWHFQCIYLLEAKEHYVQLKIYLHKLIIS